MVQQFLKHIERHALFSSDEKLLLAVSGGVDSMVLLDLCEDANLNYEVLHCNFGLRGEDAMSDEQFVTDKVNALNKPLHVKRFKTKEYAEEHGVSVEMAARELRYKWFEAIREEVDGKWILTAHHLNDSLETILFNLTKGTGISGVRGIYLKAGYIVRPLLFASGKDLRDYAGSKEIAWREDVSNDDEQFMRNKIRHQVVPRLREINPSLERTFLHTVERLAATEKIYHAYIKNIKPKVFKKIGGEICLDLKPIMDFEAGEQVLYELLIPYGFKYVQVKQLWEGILNKSIGSMFISGDYCIHIDRDQLILSKDNSFISQEVSVDHQAASYELDQDVYQVRILPRKNVLITDNQNTALLDQDKLEFPLRIRPWRDGDRFVPLGMQQKKKLSDFMIDEKIPLKLKEGIYVLESKGEIVWVIGLRIDNRFKITENTENVFMIKKS